MYDFLASTLLDIHQSNINSGFCSPDITFVTDSIRNYGDFGFTAQMNYSGLMAQPSRTGRNRGIVKREKQGLFDIFINTGSFFDNSGVTHRNILEATVRYTTLDKCFDVWRGVDPATIASDNDENAILTVLLLMFFEQEVNWGNEVWQRYTYFSPKVRIPNRIRPRDMLMGFVYQAFELGVANIAYWQYSRPSTTTFISPDSTNYGFEDYPDEYKQYFLSLQNDNYARALMVGEAREAYREIANEYPNNQYFGGL